MLNIPPLDDLISLLGRLPGVGQRTATRYAFHILAEPEAFAAQLGQRLEALHASVRQCERCGNFTASEQCYVCRDPKRDSKLLCVVARVQDLLALERGGAYRGRYFVLHQLIAPLEGVGPDAMPVAAIRGLIETDQVSELILATPLSVDGEATALYLSECLANPGLHITRIASGIPQGGELEYTDHLTLEHALTTRRPL